VRATAPLRYGGSGAQGPSRDPFMPLRSRPKQPYAAATAACTAALVALLLPSPAAAYERQWRAGGSFGYTALLTQDADFHGYGGGVHLDYGLNDALNLMVRADVFTYPEAKVWLPSGGAGIGYVIDVLDWVPYLGALAGVADVASTASACDQEPSGDSTPPPCHALKLALHVPFGIDYLVTKNFAVGAAGRYQLLLLNGSPSHTIGAFLKAEYVWSF
jgi:hypothetical protein